MRRLLATISGADSSCLPLSPITLVPFVEGKAHGALYRFSGKKGDPVLCVIAVFKTAGGPALMVHRLEKWGARGTNMRVEWDTSSGDQMLKFTYTRTGGSKKTGKRSKLLISELYSATRDLSRTETVAPGVEVEDPRKITLVVTDVHLAEHWSPKEYSYSRERFIWHPKGAKPRAVSFVFKRGRDVATGAVWCGIRRDRFAYWGTTGQLFRSMRCMMCPLWAIFRNGKTLCDKLEKQWATLTGDDWKKLMAIEQRK
ncbi:hypothetical protein KKF84_21200 [Myxococcota bacterium]|nr:hypothetical protein [Myxococcota bacterium]